VTPRLLTRERFPSVKRGTIGAVIWVWVVLVVALVGGVVVVAVGRGGTMAETYDDRPDRTLPAGRPLTADDIRDLHFTTAVRGYRMDEVDAFLARLSADLLARENGEPVEGPAHRAAEHRLEPDPQADAEAVAETETDTARETDAARATEDRPSAPGAHRDPEADR
jgi:DivIVA domain-containing protein